MGTYITAAQVGALLNVSTLVSATVEAFPFIPVSEAFVLTVLSDANVTYSTLTDDQKTLVKAAMACHCAISILSEKLRGNYKTPVQSQDVPDQKNTVARLKEQMDNYLEMVGVPKYAVYSDSAGGDDYVPDEENLLNISLTDTESAFSQFD